VLNSNRRPRGRPSSLDGWRPAMVIMACHDGHTWDVFVTREWVCDGCMVWPVGSDVASVGERPVEENRVALQSGIVG